MLEVSVMLVLFSLCRPCYCTFHVLCVIVCESLWYFLDRREYVHAFYCLFISVLLLKVQLYITMRYCAIVKFYVYMLTRADVEHWLSTILTK